jgi:mycofactocin system transcriptional regulator
VACEDVGMTDSARTVGRNEVSHHLGRRRAADSSRGPAGHIGRRPATTKDRISGIGIELFTTRGFEETSIDEVAEAAGIARRTFFRYFPSKNALPWGDFDVHLAEMRRQLAEIPSDTPLADALTRALLDFNVVPPDQTALHRARMSLILTVPSLQGYSMVMYEGWRGVIADYVAVRTGGAPTDHVPRTVGWLLLGVAVSAYEQWLRDDESSLSDLLRIGARSLHQGVAGLVPEHR